MSRLLPEDILKAYHETGVKAIRQHWIRWRGYADDICVGAHPAFVQLLNKYGGQAMREREFADRLPRQIIIHEHGLTLNYLTGFQAGVGTYGSDPTDEQYNAGWKDGHDTYALLQQCPHLINKDYF